MPRLQPIIGLEIHVRLKTKSKVFCRCPNVDDTTPPNTAICPVCTGQPGALPTINQEALRLGVRAGLALGSHIPDVVSFDRKNYFYPDLPKGYQITQYDHPVAEGGELHVSVPGNPPPREHITIHLERAHLEEDAAKNVHDGGQQHTLVDFNRAGVPLLEIVTKPDFRAPLEAKIFLQELQSLLRAIGSSEADMEKGYMRCDANISLLPVDDNNLPLQASYNPKVEIKNLNSFRSVERALIYEISRQGELLSQGLTPQGATRGWDENTGKTTEQRLKETNADYRYFPEPDLPAVSLVTLREQEQKNLPELPIAKRARLQTEWSFSENDAAFLVSRVWDEYAEAVFGELGGWMESTDGVQTHSGGELLEAEKPLIAKLIGTWMSNKLAGLLNERGIDHPRQKITAENLAEFFHLLRTNVITSASGLKLLGLMIDTGSDPSHLLEEHNLGQQNDSTELSATVARIIEQNPDQVAQIRAGKLPLVMWFVGCVMKASEGRANPAAAEKEIRTQLGL
ncbi:Asp-tRNA(Asn)/Glu-tRNA(Gln) amidotransferase subunit GatB [Patescibacteria group bacterium]|nr:Asp-tRNA(Asn)/Glu-tRNA(Gln) amidotransferase subunit GatB [Patescibacteria group bacterium]